MRLTSSGVRFAVLCVMVFGARCPVVSAQWDPAFTASLGQGYGALALSQSILSGTRALAGADTGHSRRAPLPREVLTFTSDPRISERVRASVMEALARENPRLRPQMEQAFAGHSVLQLFERFMSGQGYSSHNVAEVTNMWLLVNWELATGSAVTPAQKEGSLEQVRDVFLNTPELRAASNAERQELVERMAYQVVISSVAKRQFAREGAREQLAGLRRAAVTTLQQQGIEVGRLRLTDHGFVALH